MVAAVNLFIDIITLRALIGKRFVMHIERKQN